MKAPKNITHFFVVVVLGSVLLMGCAETSNNEKASDSTAVTDANLAEVEEDAASTESAPPSLDNLELRSVELEARLQKILAEIKEKEQALARDRSNLQARALELDNAEKSLKTQRIISWIVFGLGLVGIFLGIGVGGRRKQPPPPATGGEAGRAKTDSGPARSASKPRAGNRSSERPRSKTGSGGRAKSRPKSKRPPKRKPTEDNTP